jgi:hypothetical protein
MFPGMTSAAPADLDAYVVAAGEGTARLRAAATELRAALDAFRASEGRAAFLADVPEVDLDLTFLVQRWDRLAGWLATVADAFAVADSDGDGTARVLDLALLPRVGSFDHTAPLHLVDDDGRLVVDTGGGSDLVAVVEHPGWVEVVVGRRSYAFDLAAGDGVLVRLGAGNDVLGASAVGRAIEVEGGAGADWIAVDAPGAVLRGGAGDDVLSGGGSADRLLGGDGADRLLGGGGADRLIGGDGGDVIDGDAGADRITAGAGDDLVYGGEGADHVDGGAGRDHLDGGAEADHLSGAAGDDIVSGGEGHDTLAGGAGADVVLAGPGTDLVTGGAGVDTVHVEGDDVVPGDGEDTVLDRPVDLALLDAIVIDPPDGAFAARVRSDLVTLASTATGSALLASLRGRVITVVEDLGLEGLSHADAYDGATDTVQYALDDDHPGFGAFTAASLRRRPSYSPLVALHHELAHAAHDVNGTRVPGRYHGPDREQLDTNRDGRVTEDDDDEPDEDGDGRPDHDVPVANEERATVGLPVDHDEDPDTPDLPADEVHDGIGPTENDLRRELGLPERERY